jgi:hypothetical protein
MYYFNKISVLSEPVRAPQTFVSEIRQNCTRFSITHERSILHMLYQSSHSLPAFYWHSRSSHCQPLRILPFPPCSLGRLNPVTPVRVPLPKIFVVFGTTIFARSSNADTCIFTCVPVATRWLYFF